MKVLIHVLVTSAGIRHDHDPVDLEPGDTVAYSDDVNPDSLVLRLSPDGNVLDVTVKATPGAM